VQNSLTRPDSLYRRGPTPGGGKWLVVGAALFGAVLGRAGRDCPLVASGGGGGGKWVLSQMNIPGKFGQGNTKHEPPA
jgi:hypothetical protein